MAQLRTAEEILDRRLTRCKSYERRDDTIAVGYAFPGSGRCRGVVGLTA